MTPDWTETEYDRHRYRYRFDGKEHANPSAGLELESYDPNRSEWRRVNNLNSRDWFTMGFIACQAATGQVEMML